MKQILIAVAVLSALGFVHTQAFAGSSDKGQEALFPKQVLHGAVSSLSLSTSSFDTLIVGGEKVDDFSDTVSKHTVRLLIRNRIAAAEDNPQDMHGRPIDARCSGVVVAVDQIVTAAHCFPKKYRGLYREKPFVYTMDLENVEVRVYSHYTNGPGTEDPSGILARKVVRHPEFDDLWQDGVEDSWSVDTPVHDIAVVSLEYGLPGYKSPVSLDSHDDVIEAASLTLAGYGQSHTGSRLQRPHLRKVDTPFREMLPNGTDFVAGAGDLDSPEENPDAKGACFGDSGGPAYFQDDDGQFVLGGIIARGPVTAEGKCLMGLTVMTHVASYLNFLWDHLD